MKIRNNSRIRGSEGTGIKKRGGEDGEEKWGGKHVREGREVEEMEGGKWEDRRRDGRKREKRR